MLLWFGKWVRGTVLDDQGGQRVEDLAGDVALQASDDFGLRQAFVGAALGVGAGAWVVAEAAKNDNVERVVGATVAAAIEPVAVGASAAGGDRCGAAEVREGGFGLDPVKVVAGADEHLAGDLGSNPGKGKQGRGSLLHQLMKLLVGFGDLLRKLLMATGQPAQRRLGGVFGVAELVSWTESGAGRNHLQGGQVPQLLA